MFDQKAAPLIVTGYSTNYATRPPALDADDQLNASAVISAGKWKFEGVGGK
jgi:hypothetical protein